MPKPFPLRKNISQKEQKALFDEIDKILTIVRKNYSKSQGLTNGLKNYRNSKDPIINWLTNELCDMEKENNQFKAKDPLSKKAVYLSDIDQLIEDTKEQIVMGALKEYVAIDGLTSKSNLIEIAQEINPESKLNDAVTKAENGKPLNEKENKSLLDFAREDDPNLKKRSGSNYRETRTNNFGDEYQGRYIKTRIMVGVYNKDDPKKTVVANIIHIPQIVIPGTTSKSPKRDFKTIMRNNQNAQTEAFAKIQKTRNVAIEKKIPSSMAKYELDMEIKKLKENATPKEQKQKINLFKLVTNVANALGNLGKSKMEEHSEIDEKDIFSPKTKPTRPKQWEKDGQDSLLKEKPKETPGK